MRREEQPRQRPRGKSNLVLVDINEKSSVDGVKRRNGVKEWKRVEAGEWQKSG